MKILCYSFIIVFLLGCKSQTKKEKFIIDAGSFLDSVQKKEVENILSKIDKKSNYHLYFYTVIAEKYYKHENYDWYLFDVISKRDTVNNNNILLYLSYEDKKIRINTGNKARLILTDSLSQVAVNRLIPFLSKRKYFDGIKSTINYIDSLFTNTKNGG
jgi:uncharacterized membrane protein YgcG